MVLRYDKTELDSWFGHFQELQNSKQYAHARKAVIRLNKTAAQPENGPPDIRLPRRGNTRQHFPRKKNWRHTPNQAFGKNGKAKHFVLGTTEKPNTSLWETWAANASLFNNSCAARSDKTPWPALGTHSVQLRPKGRRRYPQWCWRFGWFNVLQTLKLWNGEKLKVWIFENSDGLKLWKTWKFDILNVSMF